MNDFTQYNLADEFAASSTFSRRVFVKGVGFVSLALLMGTFGGCENFLDQIQHRPIRRRLRTGSTAVDGDIATYAQAVQMMKDLDASSPTDARSWQNQAAVHGSISGGFKFCEHGTDHFFDWHRAYLLYFEKICQQLTGNAKFGLPYWNWNQNPAINPAFLDPSSSLYMARGITDMSAVWEVSTAALDPIMADTNFFTFAQQIEGTPHNTVHSTMGGTMGSGGSPLDPVFWTHHCMVDYCWAKWNMDLNNDNPNDATWGNHVNSHFVDATGTPLTVAAAITTLMPLISYQYESSAMGSSPAREVAAAEYKKLEKRMRDGADIRFDIKQRARLADTTAISIGRPSSHTTRLSASDFAGIINADTAKDRVFASVEYAQLPATSDFAVRVFLNLPTANANTPLSDAHYAGSFAFFGTDKAPAGGTHKHQPHFLVNLTDALQRLKRTGEMRDGTPISLQLVAVPFSGRFEKADTELRLTKLEIITTPVIVNPRPQ